VKRPKRKAPQAPPPTTSKWLALECVGYVTLIVLIGSLYIHFASVQSHHRSLEQRLKRWKIKYLLSDAEISRLRAVEEAFHGTGSPFTRENPTLEENARHRREIAALLPTDAAQRFLQSQKPDQKEDSDAVED